MPKSLEEQVDDFKHIVSQLDFIDGQSLCMWAWRLNDECLSFGQCAAAAFMQLPQFWLVWLHQPEMEQSNSALFSWRWHLTWC